MSPLKSKNALLFNFTVLSALFRLSSRCKLQMLRFCVLMLITCLHEKLRFHCVKSVCPVLIAVAKETKNQTENTLVLYPKHEENLKYCFWKLFQSSTDVCIELNRFNHVFYVGMWGCKLFEIMILIYSIPNALLPAFPPVWREELYPAETLHFCQVSLLLVSIFKSVKSVCQ